MKRLTILAAVGAITLTATVPAMAQQVAPAAPPIIPYGTPISLDMAKKAMDAAEAEATRNNWPVAIVIVDSGGNPVMLHRLDNTQIGSIRVAEGKARTAVEFRRPTKAMEDAVAGGGAGLRLLAIPGAMVLEGGVPILVEGKIIGAIGVSGVLSSQDAQVAKAGADALAK